jgi:hypothetical protein
MAARALCLAVALAGCDVGATDEPSDTPPVHLTGVLAASALSSDGSSLVFSPVDVAGGTTQVLSTTSFKLQFDRLLLPASATRQAVCLESVLTNVVNSNACAAGVFLSPSYDPVRREVTYRQMPGNPRMIPGERYQLSVFTAIADTDNGIRSFDGVPLEEPASIEVGVLDDPQGMVPPYEPLPSGDHFCTSPDPTCTDASTCARSVSLVLKGCSYSPCHRGNPDTAAEALELGSPATLLATAIGHTAHETETGEAAADPQPTSLRFGRAMPILEPKVPGDSYLIYKLLARHGLPLTLPFPPDPSGDPTVDPPEVVRLRSFLVVGMPMPPSDVVAGVPLRAGEPEWLSAWLLQGAPLPACP